MPSVCTEFIHRTRQLSISLGLPDLPEVVLSSAGSNVIELYDTYIIDTCSE